MQQTFLAYYWMRQGDRGHSSLCERITASSYEDAVARVEERLQRRTFTFDSENHGRVLVVSEHVQYVELEAVGPESGNLPEGF